MSTTIGGLRFTILGGDVDDVLIGKLAKQYGGDNWRALHMDIRTLVAGHLELYDKAWTKSIKSNKRRLRVAARVPDAVLKDKSESQSHEDAAVAWADSLIAAVEKKR